MKRITVYSKDMSSFDERLAALWPMQFACLCEAAAKSVLWVRPPVLILNNSTVVPTNHEAINELSSEFFSDALLAAWESDDGFELDLAGYKRTFKFASCKKRDIESTSTIVTDEEPVLRSMDVFTVQLFNEPELNKFLEAFVLLLPFAEKELSFMSDYTSQKFDLQAIKDQAAKMTLLPER